jgi:hypothetical protein
MASTISLKMHGITKHIVLTDTQNIDTVRSSIPKDDLKNIYLIRILNGDKVFSIFKVYEPILYIITMQECYIILPEDYFENDFYRIEINRIYETVLGDDRVMMINRLESGLCELVIFKLDINEILYPELEPVNINPNHKCLEQLYVNCIEIYSRKIINLESPHYVGNHNLIIAVLPNLEKLSYMVFGLCTNLNILEIGNPKVIEDSAFTRTNIEYFENGEITEICEKAFKLSSIVEYGTSRHLKKIKQYAFHSTFLENLHLHKDISHFDMSSVVDTSIKTLIIPHSIEFKFDSLFDESDAELFVSITNPLRQYEYKLILKTLVCSRQYKNELVNYFKNVFIQEFIKEYTEFVDFPLHEVFNPEIIFRNIIVLSDIKLTYWNISINNYLNKNAKQIIYTIMLLQNRFKDNLDGLPKEIYFLILSFVENYTLQTNIN